MLLVHVVHGSPEIVGDADSICSLRAGISIGIILGATSLLAVWGSDDLFVRGLVSPLALWMLAPLARLAGAPLLELWGLLIPLVGSTIWNVRLFKLQHGA